MDKAKISGKALKNLVNDSMRDAIDKLELPKASRKVKKIVARSSKKLAAEFSSLLKKERKKKKKIQKSLTYVEDVLKGKKKNKKVSKPVVVQDKPSGLSTPAHL